MGARRRFIGLIAVALGAVGFGLLAAGPSSVAAAGKAPPACNAQFQFPGPGLYTSPGTGCLVPGGLSISPRTVDVGGLLTATLKPPANTDKAYYQWDWSQFVQLVGGGKKVAGCDSYKGAFT